MKIRKDFTGVQVGDKLIVRPDVAAMSDCLSGKVLEMDDFAGQTVTVSHITSSRSIRIQEDSNCWSWSYDLFLDEGETYTPVSLSDFIM
jgi:hypothetical protein